MNEPELGKIIDENNYNGADRDAIHIAIIAVIASQDLKPGERIGLIGRTSATWCVGKVEENDEIGIVDPFLKENVKDGERFWMFLFPRTITSLRHIWTHPAFKRI